MTEITAAELIELQNSGSPFQLIDVREPFEFDEVSIPGALLIPLATVLDNTHQIRTDLPVIVQCRSGMRSQTAIKALEQRAGYTNLSNLKGGILAYLEAKQAQ